MASVPSAVTPSLERAADQDAERASAFRDNDKTLR